MKLKLNVDMITFEFLDRVQDVKLSLHLAGVLLKTGEATDEDLQSLASMLSTNTLGFGYNTYFLCDVLRNTNVIMT